MRDIVIPYGMENKLFYLFYFILLSEQPNVALTNPAQPQKRTVQAAGLV